MIESIKAFHSGLIEKKDPMNIGFETLEVGHTYSSYFDPEIKFVVKESPIMDLVSKIQMAKKTQTQLENWHMSEVITRLEKLKSLIVDHSQIISEMEAHFQGTSEEFQEHWSINAVLSVIDDLLANADKLDLFVPKGLIGAITSRSQSFFEIGYRVLYSLFHKNGLVLKPARSGSVSAAIWTLLLKECDLPEGLITFVYGTGSTVGKFLMEHPGVKNISFSGNHETLKSYSFSLEKKYQLYFNGKNSACVLGDFDYKNQISEIANLFIEHNGKSVFSPSRLLVLDSVEKDFKTVLAEYLGTVPAMNSPKQKFGFLPLNLTEKTRLHELSEQFKKEEAKPIFQNDRFSFYSDLANCSELYQEDLELPIYNLTGVKYSFDMARWINNTSFGHSMVIFGPEEKAKKLALKSEVGDVFYNPNPLPFRWVNPVKLSGFGETGHEIPNRFYSYIKTTR